MRRRRGPVRTRRNTLSKERFPNSPRDVSER